MLGPFLINSRRDWNVFMDEIEKRLNRRPPGRSLGLYAEAGGQFAIEHNVRKAVILHAGDEFSPAQLCLQ
ncbi:hypothetical protein LOAG_04999 [Loa loa]|uniref:Uncharacterized protein n=1 Tax=Loa loa TaxID=7209 RepID=A0A1S0U0X4_LOALO|nr:hypothetical protein LOAG_04999 [Loa loa]EFO23485.1 hypothetical protein LOAG_04999 [Loa loa]